MKTGLIVGGVLFLVLGGLLYWRARKRGANLPASGFADSFLPLAMPPQNDPPNMSARDKATTTLRALNTGGCAAGAAFLGAGPGGAAICGPVGRVTSGITSSVVGGAYDTVKNVVTLHPIDAAKSIISTPVNVIKSLKFW